MYRSIFFSTLALSLWLGAASLQFSHSRLPQPKERDKEGAENNEARKAWYEAMHKTAPNQNWREIEFQNRLERQAQRQQLRTASTQDVIGGISGTWREIGSINNAGRTRYMDVDYSTNKLYVIADGGSVWQGNIDGTGWICLNQFFQLEDAQYLKVLTLPSGTKRILAAANNKLMISDDMGQTWNSSPATAAGCNTYKFLYYPNTHTLYLLGNINGGSGQGLYASTDYGNSFSFLTSLPTTLYGGDPQMDICLDEDGSGQVYMVAKRKSYIFNGTNFTLQTTISTNTAETEVVLSGIESNGQTTLYAAFESGSDTQVYQSVNGGTTWTAKGNISSEHGFTKNSFTVSSLNPNLLFFGGMNTYRSTNGGSTWTPVNQWYDYYGNEATKLHADIPSIQCFPRTGTSEDIFINTDGGLYISKTQLQSVQNLSLNGLQVSQYYSIYTHKTQPQFLYAGSQDQGFQRASTDNAALLSFQQTISGDYGHIVSGDGGQNVWANYPGFTLFYPNLPNQLSDVWWEFDAVGMSGNLWIPPLMEDPNDPNAVFLGGGSVSGGAHIFHLQHSGGNITHTELPYDFGGSIAAMAYDNFNHAIRYTMNTSGNFYSSNDGGNTWTPNTVFNGPGSHYFYGSDIMASPAQAGRVYVAGSGYGNPAVFVSDDYGANFTALTNGLPSTLVFQLAATPDDELVFAATESGPYMYKKSDNQWYYMGGVTAPDETYWTVEYVPLRHAVRFGTYGRGIWEFNICDANSPQVSVADFTPNVGSGYVTFQASAQNAWNYLWNFGDGQSGMGQNPSHIYSIAGTYTVQLIAQGFCSSDTIEKQIQLLNVQNQPASPAFSLYPNPCQDYLHIQGSPSAKVAYCYDLQGKLLRKEAITNEILLTSEFTQGVYLLELRDAQDNILHTQKISVLR